MAGFAFQFGISTDKLVPSDYDGDGKTDLAVYRDGTWYLQRSMLGFAAIGRTDIAVYRDGVWHVKLSWAGYRAFQFGSPGDIPVPLDYNGFGYANLAFYRDGARRHFESRSKAASLPAKKLPNGGTQNANLF